MYKKFVLMIWGDFFGVKKISPLFSVEIMEGALLANQISETVKVGTIGELLVQLRLLQYDVQAAPPIKDSGNDLIALKGKVCKLLQIKTTTRERFVIPDEKIIYDILAVVHLEGKGTTIFLDMSSVFLLPKEKVSGITPRNIDKLHDFKLDEKIIRKLFR